jgi:hypothetical protein
LHLWFSYTLDSVPGLTVVVVVMYLNKLRPR